MRYYFFYKTTNTVNNKVYYGVHSTQKINDTYLGSGNAIKAAIKKYGRSVFTREILCWFEDDVSMYAYEKKFITEDVVNDHNTYNETLGGVGGFSHIDTRGAKNPMKNPTVVAKNTASRRSNPLNYTEEKKNVSRNNLKKAVEVNIGKKRPAHAEFMSQWSKQYWAENKEYLRDVYSSWFCLLSPDGVEYKTNRLKDFCREHNLTYVSVWDTSRTGKPVSKGKSKGWICTRINNELLRTE